MPPDPASNPADTLTTVVSRPVARGMIAAFLALLFAVPLYQAAAEVAAGRRPGVLAFPTGGIPGRAELKRYEDSLREQSRPARFCQPRLQHGLTAWGGFGSTAVVVGRGGWLFYRPGLDSVTGPGFLDPATLHRRARNRRDAAVTESPSPDPRPAIRQFHQQLAVAGVHLVLLPIPDKATLQPADLAGPRAPVPPPHNPSFAALVAELREAGVDVFDPSPPLVRPGEARFLMSDTHWTPEWMDEVARALADRVRPHLPPADWTPFRREPVTLSAPGDLAEMLQLPDDQALFPLQAVTVERILDPAGRPLRSDPGSPVLLLGDSFTNIYSAGAMGWGGSAGLAEHLAAHLGRPVDWLGRNDAGAHATREMLAAQRAGGRDRLAGKRVVVWQFAARELALGDWKLVPLP